MKKQIIKIPALFLLILSILSCVDDEIGNVNNTLTLNPGYSLPLGSIDVKLEEIVDEFGGDLFEIPDSLLSDTSLIFFYNYVNYVSPFTLEHTELKQFDFSTIAAKLEHIKTLSFRLNSINEIPGRVDIQTYFLDANMTAIDSLFNTGRLTIESAKIDDDGNLLSAGETRIHTSSFDRIRLEKLQYAEYVEIHAILYIEEINGKNIKYLSKQKFWFQLGLRVEFDLPLHEL